MAETATKRWYVSKPSLFAFWVHCTFECLSPEYCALQQHLMLLLVLSSSPMTHGLGLYCDCHNQLHVYYISTVNE